MRTLSLLALVVISAALAWPRPISQPGLTAEYRIATQGELRPSVVSAFTVSLGAVETRAGREYQWFAIDSTKPGIARSFRVWLLTDGYPAVTLEAARLATLRYVIQEGGSPARDFRSALDDRPVLPSMGGWDYLIPRGEPSAGPFPVTVRYLGHAYNRVALRQAAPAAPPAEAQVLKLRADTLIGPPSTRRQKDETRRYDETEYEFQDLTRDDYSTMAAHGVNCVNVTPEGVDWAEKLGIFYYGAGATLPFPEFLYRPLYLGPVLYLDEPAVTTRDYVLRPRLAKDEEFRRSISPQAAFEAFQKRYAESMDHAATALNRTLAGRKDVDAGDMKFHQRNLYSWETMVSTYAWELSQDQAVPEAVVFEPPGRIGSARTLPEMNMTYGTQFPAANPEIFADILFGFLRGAARATGKNWGVSIYGSVQRADTNFWFTHAYDMGATRFHFWDNAMLACVPFNEVLALSKLLHDHAANNPHRDLARLRTAAEVAILLPPGYDLGHVHTGKGQMWGIGELNLERTNRAGLPYRTVMSNFFQEVERAVRQGVAFDLLWDLPATQPKGYREVVRVREDGKVEVDEEGRHTVLDGPRQPGRPSGAPPRLSVTVSADTAATLDVTAHAHVEETTAPVYYTMGGDPTGVYHNAMVAFELYGPEAPDHRFLSPERLRPRVTRNGKKAEVDMPFAITRPGTYRLRAATVDVAGRTTIVWKTLKVDRTPTNHLELK